MKFDELKPLIFNIADLAYVDEISVSKNFQNPHDHAVYKATEVDAAIDELKSENQRLSNALDKERRETIKYMDELCNAKNEIERLTIDKRGVELRADIADATIEKLKARIAELEEERRWRKCSEEKPNEEQFVLAWLTEDGKRGFFLTSYFINGEFLIGEDPHGCKPTYWMPLPSAPKDEA